MLQRFYKMYRVDDAEAVGVGGGGGQQGLQHFLVCQGRRDLPAQRHDADAVGNAPAQTAHHIIAVAALAGDVFLGYGAVGAGQAQAEGTFSGRPAYRSYWAGRFCRRQGCPAG